MEQHSRRYSNLEPFEDHGKYRKLRQMLNVGFIAGAAIGMIWYGSSKADGAIYLLIAASALKFVELTLRMMKL